MIQPLKVNHVICLCLFLCHTDLSDMTGGYERNIRLLMLVVLLCCCFSGQNSSTDMRWYQGGQIWVEKRTKIPGVADERRKTHDLLWLLVLHSAKDFSRWCFQICFLFTFYPDTWDEMIQFKYNFSTTKHLCLQFWCLRSIFRWNSFMKSFSTFSSEVMGGRKYQWSSFSPKIHGNQTAFFTAIFGLHLEASG